MISDRPLLTGALVCHLADITEDVLVDLVEEGLLYPAWNICYSTKAARRELRILSAGLTYYAATQRPLPVVPEDVVNDLFPPDAPVTTVTLQRTLNCKGEHIRQLVKSGQLRLAPGATLKRGPGAAAVTRQSCIAWLNSRVL